MEGSVDEFNSGYYKHCREAECAEYFGASDRAKVAGMVDYLRATYQCGRALAGWGEIKARYGSYPLDGIGQHLYIDQGGATNESNLSAYLQDVRDAYAAFEGRNTDKQTFVTEFGWATNAITPALQAANLRVACDTFRRTPYVAQAYWAGIQDIPAAELYFGLARSDGSLKPAFAAYQAATSPTP